MLQLFLGEDLLPRSNALKVMALATEAIDQTIAFIN